VRRWSWRWSWAWRIGQGRGVRRRTGGATQRIPRAVAAVVEGDWRFGFGFGQPFRRLCAGLDGLHPDPVAVTQVPVLQALARRSTTQHNLRRAMQFEYVDRANRSCSTRASAEGSRQRENDSRSMAGAVTDGRYGRNARSCSHHRQAVPVVSSPSSAPLPVALLLPCHHSRLQIARPTLSGLPSAVFSQRSSLLDHLRLCQTRILYRGTCFRSALLHLQNGHQQLHTPATADSTPSTWTARTGKYIFNCRRSAVGGDETCVVSPSWRGPRDSSRASEPCTSPDTLRAW
jgi:hypothetical protein